VRKCLIDETETIAYSSVTYKGNSKYHWHEETGNKEYSLLGKFWYSKVPVPPRSQQKCINPPHRTSRKVSGPTISQQKANSFICVCTGGDDSNKLNVPRKHTGYSVIAFFYDAKRPIPFTFLWKRTFQRRYIRIYSEHSLRVFVFSVRRGIKTSMEYINWRFLSSNLISLYREALSSKYVYFARTENVL
jgi:hypothetical protein